MDGIFPNFTPQAYSSGVSNAGGWLTQGRKTLSRANQLANHYHHNTAQSSDVYVPSELSFGNRYLASTAKWSARAVGVALADRYATPVKVGPGIQRLLQSSVGQLSEEAVPYVVPEVFDIEKKMSLKEAFKYFTSTEGKVDYSNQVKWNLRNSFSNFGRNLNLKNFFTKTLGGGNLAPILNPLTEGKIFQTCIRSLGPLMVGYSVIKNTLRAYHYAKSKEDGSLWSKLKTIGSTALAFVGHSVKSLICWELGTIGYGLASCIFCFGSTAATGGLILPAVLASIAVGVVVSTVGYKLLSKLIPDPPKLK